VELWVAIVIVVALDAAVAGAMLWIRRRAPDGSYFHDSQRAAGAFAVGGTTFAVIVGFVFLLAFQSYQSARSNSRDESLAALALFNAAEHFRPPAEAALQSDILCSSRAVISDEWPAMADERSSPLVENWLFRLNTRFARLNPRGTAESDAAQNWFDESDALETGRRGRLAEASRVVPTTIWVLLLLAGAGVVGFVLLFADSGERRVSQVAMVLTVTTAIAVSLLTVNFVDRPYGNHDGAITPSAMQGVLATMEREQAALGQSAPRCNAVGQPT
jgi:Protein of unknown function (DUF4239)